MKLYCSDRCRKRANRDKRKQETLSRLQGLLDQVVTGDSRELVKLLPENSVDLIFTDPPYPKEYLPLYGWLAKEAARVLKPGGFLLTYAGNMYLHEVMMSLGQHLTYFWSYIALDSGQGTVVWPRKTVARHKAILAYSKGPGKPRCNTLDVWNGSGKDKHYHSWGQDVTTARYYIDCFSRRGHVVLEPFTGGGTTCVASKLIDRSFIGFEIDERQAEIARERLATMQLPLFDVSVSQLSLEEGSVVREAMVSEEAS
ncbi:MAG: hypothetical protein JO202_18380 [Ktedonobacteraceae bacterium]|nr:hypothetical protein [Ktedonobacteraceae bacterium]